MAKVCIIEFDYQTYTRRDNKQVNYIQSVKIESIGAENRSIDSVFSFPTLFERKRNFSETADESFNEDFLISINQEIENVSKKVRDCLKNCVEVILFSDKDKYHIKNYIDEKTAIRVIK